MLVVDGSLLLGLGLPFDLTIHLRLSAGALERRIDPDARWSLPAYLRYEQEVDPERTADVVVRMDDPRHPARAQPAALWMIVEFFHRSVVGLGKWANFPLS